MKSLSVKFGSFVSVMLIFALPLHAQTSTVPFKDHIGHDYEVAIESLFKQGIVEGYPNYTFLPDKSINRAELLKITIVSNFDKQEYSQYENVGCFPDVIETDWHSKYICFAKQKGIVEGYPDGYFRPGQNINLVESLKIIYESVGIAIKNPDAVFKFRYYSPAMLSGYIPEELKGGYDQIMTRGQISEILYRILNDEERELKSEVNLNLDVYKQKYRSSCGNAALAIALSKEFDVKEDEIIEKMIELGMYPNNQIVSEDNQYIWDDPQKVFVGDYDGIVSVNMQNISGFGFLEEPLEKLARQWAQNSFKFAEENMQFIARQVEEGHPVIVFAGVNARDGSVIIDEPGIYSTTWKIRDKERIITMPMYKHNLVVEGYEGTTSKPQMFYVVDPFYGKKMEIDSNKLKEILQKYAFSGVVVKF